MTTTSSPVAERRVGRFVGRSGPLAWLVDRLRTPGSVSSLVGLPGVGKTRLALEAAARATPACFVDLSEATDAHGLAEALAGALELAPQARDLSRAVVRALATAGPKALVLDDADGVSAPLAELLLQTARAGEPRHTWLATSRAPLGLGPGAQELVLQPFATEGRELEEAVELFLGVLPEPLQTEGRRRRATIARIVTAVSGLPLSIELAAGRLRVLSLDELGELVRDPLPLLAAPGSQRSLAQVLLDAWSDLEARERRLLERLSAWPRGVTLRELSSVCGELGTSRWEVVDGLHELALRGWVVQREASGGSLRHDLSDPVRAFARAQLSRRERDDEALARALARHWIDVADGVRDAAGTEAAAPLEASLREGGATVAAILAWALARPPDDTLATRAALSLAGWAPTAARSIRTAWLDAALARANHPAWQDEALVARVLLLRSRVRPDRAAESSAQDDLERALWLASVGGHWALALDVMLERAHRALRRLDVVRAEEHLAEARRIAEARGGDRARAQVLTSEAHLARDAGRLELSSELADRAVDLARVEGHEKTIALALMQRGVTTMRTRRAAEAEGDLTEAAALLGRVAERSLALFARGLRTAAVHAQGQLEAADTGYAAILEEASAVQAEAVLATFHACLAALLLERGELERMGAVLERTLDLARSAGERRLEGATLAALSARPALAGRIEAAERLLAESEQVMRSTGDPYAPGVTFVHRVFVDLAAIESALDDLSREDALAHLARARERVELLASIPILEALFLHRAIARRVSDAERATQGWLIARDGRAFRAPGCDVQRLSHRPLLAKLLAALLEADRGLGVRELAQVGWPGERAIPEALANRVHVAMSTLRKVGLAPLLARDDAGYRLDRGLGFRVSRGPRAS